MIRKKVHERVDAIPMRVGAYHLCIPSENKSGRVGKKIRSGSGDGGVSSGIAHLIKAMAVISIGSELRPHLRFHSGKLECRLLIYAKKAASIVYLSTFETKFFFFNVWNSSPP